MRRRIRNASLRRYLIPQMQSLKHEFVSNESALLSTSPIASAETTFSPESHEIKDFEYASDT